jgi:long-subunit acyl-CoA synthetase (AMP-forming)
MIPLRVSIAAADPGRIALADGQRTIAYGELARLIADEWQWLAAAAPGRCALLAENGCAWAIADLAQLEAGVPQLPLPTFFTAAQARHALDDAGIDTLLTDAPQRVRDQHPDFRESGTSPVTGLVRFTREVAKPPALPPGTAKITYTSGSTGTPKGVCLDLQALMSVSQSLAEAVAGSGVERHLGLLPLSTLLENIAGLYVPLLLDSSTLLPPASRTGLAYGALDPRRLLTLLATEAPHSLVLVPELLRLLVAGVESGIRLPSLRFIAVGGARVPTALLARADALGLPVFVGYGLSECASVVCLNTPAARRIGSVGRPLPHARVSLGAGGEILVEGAVLRGYLGEAPRAPGPYRTGDLGSIDADRYVHVNGRLRNLFITSLGRNISPEWVESELLSAPQVAQAMVIGEARPFPVALVTRAAGASDADVAAAITQANARLPDYAQLRGWIDFSTAPSVANALLTSNGRLRRDAILSRESDRIDTLYETLSPRDFADEIS